MEKKRFSDSQANTHGTGDSREPAEWIVRHGLSGGNTLPTGTVTFLFTDIEGSTPHWERNPERIAVGRVRFGKRTVISRCDGMKEVGGKGWMQT